jgi:hypothetical protein
MHILVVLLSILVIAAVLFYGLLALLRQTIDDGPYAPPAAFIVDAMQQPATALPSKDAQRRSRSEGCA